MSMRYPGGFIASTPVTANYPSGVWTQAQAIPYQAQNVWTRDQYWPYTTLLLQGNGTNGAQNNTFLDSSSNNFTITRNGNTTQGSFTPYESNGYWSNYFDGTGDYLTVASNAAFGYGTGDFTIEFWYLPLSFGVTNIIVDQRTSGATEVVPTIYTDSSSGTLYYYVNGANRITGGNLTLNSWQHIAVSRSGTSTRLFVNGVQVGSTYSDSNNYANSLVSLGAYAVNGTLFANAYISNLRIVKGTALYTAAFTPPTAPLTAITNTQLLTCQSNRFIDNSTNAFAITRNGDTSVQAFQPFPGATTYSGTVLGGSAYFDGTGDYFTVADNAALDFGTGDFTVEGWFYFNALSNQPMLFFKFTGGVGWFLQASASVIYFGYGANTASQYWAFSTTLVTGTWYHLAVTRVGSTLSIYINGTKNSTTLAGANSSYDNAADFVIASYRPNSTALDLNGYISDFRVVKGTAVYTANFTPPTAPLTAITNTSLLLNFTNAGIFDAAVMNDLETVGNAQVSTSVVKYGTGSMAFDGSGDYLLPRPGTTDLFAFGSGDWTLEFWVYPVSSTGMLIDWRPTSTSGAYITLYLASGVPYLFVNTADRITGTAIPSSAWTHLAICRSGTSTRMFINGTQAGGTYSDSTVYLNSAGRPLIAANGFDLNGSPVYFNGYIDDLRITKGVARYITSFTPPPARMPGQ